MRRADWEAALSNYLTASVDALVKARAIPHSPMAAFGKQKKDFTVDPDQPERLFSDEDLRSELLSATDPVVVHKLLTEWSPYAAIKRTAAV